MNEKRTVLGYIQHPTSKNPEIAFPQVLIWICSDGEQKHDPFADFPEKGTIFLHASAASNVTLVSHSYGLFSCEYSPNQSAPWKVSKTLDTLRSVVSIDTPLENITSFYRSISNGNNHSFPQIILGTEDFYFLTQDNYIVGPFKEVSGEMKAQEPLSCLPADQITTLEIVSPDRLRFIDSSTFKGGAPVPASPVDAYKKLLKMVSKQHGLSWLTRNKTAELAESFALFAENADINWILDHATDVLKTIDSSIESEPLIVEQLLSHPDISKALFQKWKEIEKEITQPLELQVQEAQGRLDKLTSAGSDYEVHLGKLRREQLELDSLVSEKRASAHSAFEKELNRLAGTPETLAILSSVLGGKPNSVTSACDWEYRDITGASDSPGVAAIMSELSLLGIRTPSARRIAYISYAAIVCGQCVVIQSELGGIIAEAIHKGLGHLKYAGFSVPAGLLEPLSPPAYQDTPLAVIMEGANRSAFQLLLAPFNRSFSLSLLNLAPSEYHLILVLDPEISIDLAQRLPMGVTITNSHLKIGSSKRIERLPSIPKLESIGLLEKDELDELFPIDKFPQLENPTFELGARRFFQALRDLGLEDIEATKMLADNWLGQTASEEHTSKVDETAEDVPVEVK